MKTIIQEEEFRYIESGKGQPLIILHGLMGGLSNFKGVLDYFPKKGYKVIIPELPVYSLPLLNTSVKSLSEFLLKFVKFRSLKNFVLLGNSLGGHVGLLFSRNHPELVKGLILTGSSGLYENNMGDGYPKRGDYDYIKKKSEDIEILFEFEVTSVEDAQPVVMTGENVEFSPETSSILDQVFCVTSNSIYFPVVFGLPFVDP